MKTDPDLPQKPDEPKEPTNPAYISDRNEGRIFLIAGAIAGFLFGLFFAILMPDVPMVVRFVTPPFGFFVGFFGAAFLWHLGGPGPDPYE